MVVAAALDVVAAALAVASVAAEVAVAKLKLLQEVDFHTREELARMLENGLYSLGDWKQVAAEYGMRERSISGLANSKEPGKNVIEFLGGSHPDLTVYSFCRVLKHQKIRRLDIVKLLEDHF